MAAAAPALLWIAAGSAIAGTVVSTIGQVQQAEQQAAAAEAQSEAQAQAQEANARIAAQQAQIARDQAAQERRRAIIEAEVFSREARRRQGSRVSAIGASGIQLAGSAIDVLADAAFEDEQQQLFIIQQGEDRARARLQGATIEEMSAAEFTRQAAAEREIGGQLASFTRGAGLLAAGGTLLTGFSQTGLTLSQSPTFRRTFSSTG